MHSSNRVLRVMSLLPLVLVARPVRAQTSQPPVVSETVEVVATRLPESPHDVPKSIEVFTADDLRKLGATSLSEALALASGVAIAPGGDGGPASAVPEFWGLRELDAFLLVVDDVPWGGAFNPALASVSLRDVERIEILRGAAPVTYGATSFVGVIHVVHTSASADHSYLGLSGGSYRSGTAALDLALPTAHDWMSRLSVDFDRQGFSDDRTSFSRSHALFRTSRGSGNQRTWIRADLTLLRQAPASPRPRQGTALSPLVGVDVNHNPSGAFIDENRVAIGAGFDRPLGSRTLTTTVSFTHSANDLFRGFLTSVSDSPDNAIGLRQKIDQTDLYADVHLAATSRADVRLVAGADFLHGSGDSRGETFDYTAPLSGASAATVTEPADLPLGAEARRDFVGAYLMTEWRPAPRWLLSGGIRLNMTFEERGEGKDESRAAEREREEVQTHVRPSGQLSTLFTVWEDGFNHVRVFANYRDTFKPAVFDFGLGEAEGEEEALLEPEKARSYEGGVKVRLQGGRVDMEASVFRLDFTNLVTSTVVGGLPGLENTGRTRFQGVELAADGRLPRAITGRFSYSFHDGRFVDYERSFDGAPPTQLAGNRVEMSPRHLVTASVFLSPDHGLVAGVVVKHTGDRYMDKRNRALAGAFTTVDLGIGYRVHRYEVRLDGRNLTDARDPVAESEVGDAQYYLMPARNIRLSFNVRF